MRHIVPVCKNHGSKISVSNLNFSSVSKIEINLFENNLRNFFRHAIHWVISIEMRHFEPVCGNHGSKIRVANLFGFFKLEIKLFENDLCKVFPSCNSLGNRIRNATHNPFLRFPVPNMTDNPFLA